MTIIWAFNSLIFNFCPLQNWMKLWLLDLEKSYKITKKNRKKSLVGNTATKWRKTDACQLKNGSTLRNSNKMYSSSSWWVNVSFFVNAGFKMFSHQNCWQDLGSSIFDFLLETFFPSIWRWRTFLRYFCIFSPRWQLKSLIRHRNFFFFSKSGTRRK